MELDMTKIENGTLALEIRMMDDGSCTEEHILFLKDGGHIGCIINEVDAPINTPLTVKLDGHNLTAWEYDTTVAVKNRDVSRKDIALVFFYDDPPTDERIEGAKQYAKRFLDFFRKVNRFRWDELIVTPYVVQRPPNASLNNTFNFNLVKDQMEEQHPGKFKEHNYWHGKGGVRSGVAGEAHKNGYRAWTYTGTMRTTKHEQGHNFGCGHSGSYWGTDPYGDNSCIMGKAETGFNGAQNEIIRQIRDEELVSMAPINQNYYLVPLETPVEDVRDGEKLLVSLHYENRLHYKISVRKSADQDSLGSYFTDGYDVFVHCTDVVLGSDTHFMYKIAPGESQNLNGVMLRNMGHKDGAVCISLGTPQPIDWPKDKPLIEGDEFLQEHSGLWHNTLEEVQGMDLNFIPDENRVIGYWFTHHPKGVRGFGVSRIESPDWFVIDGVVVDGTIIDVDIIHCQDREAKIVGRGTMVLRDGKIKFRYNSDSHGRGNIEMSRMTTPKREASLWSTGTYEGYSVGKYEVPNASDQWVVYHYTYDGQHPTWTMYQGDNRKALQGYKTQSRFRVGYTDEVEVVPPIDLDDTLQGAVKLL